MNEVANVIADLRRRGVELSEDNGKLLCKAPKGVIDKEIKQFIVDNKPELLKCLAEENDFRLIKVTNRPPKIPLSYEQERLWFLAELGQSDQYHVPGFVPIKTKADIQLIRKVFDYLTQRHEALRTCFRKGDGEPYQLILDSVEIPLSVVHLHGESILSEEVTAACSKFVSEPFDMENGPLIRVLVIELSDDLFVLGYCLHHIISDGWSITVLQKELTVSLGSFYRGQEPNLPPLKVQFPDFSIWQRKVLSQEKMAEKIKHWKDHLSGYEDINLPTDFIRPEALSGHGDRDKLVLNRAKSGWIRDFCKSRNITLFSLMLSMIYALLNKYCRQQDICIGMPTANRNHQYLEEMIGFFANTIINRVQIKDEITLEELIMVSQKELLRSQDYQDVPFSKVVDAVKPARDASKTPIFQVLANYVNFNGQEVVVSSDRKDSVKYEYNSSKFDLNFTFSEEAGNELVVSIEYSTDLFTKSTISRMLKHYELLIESLIRDQSVKLSEIVLETVTEKRLIESFNQSEVNSWIPSLLHSKLKSSEIRFPERIAVSDGNLQVTYQQLIDQSNHIASLIIKSGNHQYIGICMDRCSEMIISFLAVLKTGAAYFTIDPEYPEERVKHMLEDSQLNCLITNSQYSSKEQFRSISNIIEVNGLFSDVVGSAEVSNENIKPDSPAYIIYTSGSTGKPKGVVQTHQTIDNISYFQQELWESNSDEQMNIGQFASASFDVSVQETFYALINNHTLFITPEKIKRAPDEYIRFVSACKLNYVFLPTAYLDIFCSEALESGQFFPDLRKIIVAGEALKITNAVRKFFGKHQMVLLENHYGPSETHVATKLTLEGDPSKWPYLPSIGKPIPNLKVQILNDSRRKVPLGGVGEIYISGAGLASGYLNNEELNAEKFVQNPYGVETLYKTGDLGRWLPDGTIGFLGRVDEQVKIRGYRVELGEVENAILEHQDVSSVFVLVKETAGTQQLIGYYTSDKELSSIDIKVLLQKRLPQYMEPSALIQVDQIPVTKNGKVDKRKLLSIEPVYETADAYLKPDTALQLTLADHWMNLLGVKNIRLNSNFFDMGGHSLLAVKLVSLIKKSMPKTHLTVMDVMKYPTIGALSNYLESDKSTEVKSPYILQFVDRGTTFIVPGMPGQSDGYHDMAVRINEENGGVYGLQMKGFLDNEQPLLSIEDMADHNLKLIKQVLPAGKINLYCHSYGGTVAYEMLQQLDVNSYNVGKLVFLDSSPHIRQPEMRPESAISLAQAIMWKYQIREESLYKQIVSLVSNFPPQQWKDNIIAHMDEHINGFDPAFFSKMWDVVRTSMSVDYSMSKQLEYSLQLVIPNASIGVVNEQAWKPYFKEVEVCFTGGDHFSMIRKEYCNEWIEKLNKTITKESEKIH